MFQALFKIEHIFRNIRNYTITISKKKKKIFFKLSINRKAFFIFLEIFITSIFSYFKEVVCNLDLVMIFREYLSLFFFLFKISAVIDNF